MIISRLLGTYDVEDLLALGNGDHFREEPQTHFI